jgi:hypothetical protein
MKSNRKGAEDAELWCGVGQAETEIAALPVVARNDD